MLQRMNFFCERISRIIFINIAGSLEDDLPMIIYLIHVMNTDAAFFFFIADHGLMYKMSIHAASAIFWQEGGMNIDDLFGISFNEFSGNHP